MAENGAELTSDDGPCWCRSSFRGAIFYFKSRNISGRSSVVCSLRAVWFDCSKANFCLIFPPKMSTKQHLHFFLPPTFFFTFARPSPVIMSTWLRQNKDQFPPWNKHKRPPPHPLAHTHTRYVKMLTFVCLIFLLVHFSCVFLCVCVLC